VVAAALLVSASKVSVDGKANVWAAFIAQAKAALEDLKATIRTASHLNLDIIKFVLIHTALDIKFQNFT
jgi:hypothetical protein